jgi:hypothetical protein
LLRPESLELKVTFDEIDVSVYIDSRTTASELIDLMCAKARVQRAFEEFCIWLTPTTTDDPRTRCCRLCACVVLIALGDAAFRVADKSLIARELAESPRE